MLEGPRAAREDEIPSVIALSNTVFAPDGRLDMGATFPTLFARSNAANLRIALDEGKPVSLAAFVVRDVELCGVRLPAVCVGSVCTLAEYRGRGIAARIMDDVMSCALLQGAVIALISGGQGLYRRMGCIDAGLFRTLRFSRGDAVPSISCDVRAWHPDDVPEITRLHALERVRFIRGPEETRALLETRRLHVQPSRTWVVRSQGSMAAYLCEADPDPATGATALNVRELAGSRLAVIAALPTVLKAAGRDTVEVDAPAMDIEMEAAARSLQLPLENRGFQGTVKIIDAMGLFAAAERYIAERLSPSERARLTFQCAKRTTIRLANEVLTIPSDEELAALVFGSVERAAPDAGPGPLSTLLRRLFPLPLPVYGLSYI